MNRATMSALLRMELTRKRASLRCRRFIPRGANSPEGLRESWTHIHRRSRVGCGCENLGKTSAIPCRMRDTRCNDVPGTRQGDENHLGLFAEQNTWRRSLPSRRSGILDSSNQHRKNPETPRCKTCAGRMQK